MPTVAIIMGSDSDLGIMKDAADILTQFSIDYELTIVSAHRTPTRMMDYAEKAKSRGIKIIIAGAGGAAHLPGMVASLTPLPVIGVPIKSILIIQVRVPFTTHLFNLFQYCFFHLLFIKCHFVSKFTIEGT